MCPVPGAAFAVPLLPWAWSLLEGRKERCTVDNFAHVEQQQHVSFFPSLAHSRFLH